MRFVNAHWIMLLLLHRINSELRREATAHIATKQKLVSTAENAAKSSMLDLELADYQRTNDALNTFVFTFIS